MDTVFGIAGKEWVIIVCDTAVNRSIFSLKHDEDKITQMGTHKIMGSAGEQCERYSFSNFMLRNIEL